MKLFEGDAAVALCALEFPRIIQISSFKFVIQKIVRHYMRRNFRLRHWLDFGARRGCCAAHAHAVKVAKLDEFAHAAFAPHFLMMACKTFGWFVSDSQTPAGTVSKLCQLSASSAMLRVLISATNMSSGTFAAKICL